MTPAESACYHLLERIRESADVARVMGRGTLAFHLLIRAEAERTGDPLEHVEERWRRCLDPNPSRVEQLERRIGELELEKQAWRQEGLQL